MTRVERICRVCGAPVDRQSDPSPTAQVPATSDSPTLTPKGFARQGAAGRCDVGILVVGWPVGDGRFELSKPTTRVGRDPLNEVFLDDVTVSRRHIEIQRIGPAYVAADCGSFNGTYLNGERIDKVMLQDRDELRVGRFAMVFFTPRRPGGCP